MIMSVLVEWCVMYSCNKGPEEGVCKFVQFSPNMGSEHSRLMLRQEALYLNEHFKKSIMGSEPIKLAGETITWVDQNIFVPIGINAYKVKAEHEKSWAWEYLMAAYNIVKVVVLRLCVLFLSLPAYLLFLVVGVTTGLVRRDLRKFGAGRESTDRFELSTRLITPSVVLCFVVYLSWPNSINPALIVVPFAALFGYALHLTTANYKKYL